MEASGILKDIIQYQETDKKASTHFALCKDNKIRYFIDLKEGKKRLSANISHYSKRLGLLMKLLNYLPFEVIKAAKLGYFVEANFCREIDEYITKKSKPGCKYNIIVGTYDNKQKLVVQLWENKKSQAVYYKIGNKCSAKEMLTEIEYLKSSAKYNTFAVPELIHAQTMDNNYEYNIQITREFSGEKVEPILTDDIFMIYKELVMSKGIEVIDSISYGFSHGDFAPWNLKKCKNGYVLFDWEHCGTRFYGFDLIHFIYQIEYLLNNRSEEEAFELALGQAQQCDKNISNKNIKELFFDEYRKIH
jgi:thiamine kinase-like enzyme